VENNFVPSKKKTDGENMTLWAGAKNWLSAKACQAFSVESWRQKSRYFAIILAVTFFMALVGIIAVIFAYIDIHVWSKQGELIMVPQSKMVEINGNLYIPIKLISG
jgi:hypothetical protein